MLADQQADMLALESFLPSSLRACEKVNVWDTLAGRS